MQIWTFDAAAAGADPTTSPGDVNDRYVIEIPPVLPNTTCAPRRLLIATLGGTAVTAQVWALLDQSPLLSALFQDVDNDIFYDPTARAARVFTKVGADLAAPQNNFNELLDAAGAALPAPTGKIYIRPTTGAGTGKVLVVGVI